MSEATQHQREGEAMGAIYGFGAGDSAEADRLRWENIPLDPGPHPPGIVGIANIPHGHIPDRGNQAAGIGSGFGWELERPIIRIKPSRSGRPPNDIEEHGRGLFIVSDRAKQVFEQIDPEAFEFEPTTTIQRVRGVDQPGPIYWLCDVVRFIDAMDESDPNTEVSISPDGVKRARVPWSPDRAIFFAAAIGDAKVFRLMYSPWTVLMTEDLRRAMKAAKLKGCDKGIWGRTDV